jgi:CMP-N-acetylneuraminate monooxygenase
VLEADYYRFVGNELVAQEKMTVDRYIDDSVSNYLEASRDKENWLDDKSIISYFQRSAFHDSLVLELRCTSDDFKECIRSFVIDFSQKNKVDAMLSRDSSGLVSEVLNNGNRFLQINVREYELYDVIKNGKPWEDLSIGFQCRIFREPNIYNSKFWFHFANVYIGRRTFPEFHLF